MESKKLLTIVVVVLATMVVSLTSFIAGMFIPRPGLSESAPAEVQQPEANAPAKPPALPGRKPSSYKIGKPYNVAMRTGRPVIAVFYVDWCHFCQAFMPKFKELSGIYRGKMTFTTVNVEDTKNADLAKKYDIKEFPSVFIINPRTQEKEKIDSSNFQSIDTMKEKIDAYLNK